jgi:hypothetical protein
MQPFAWERFARVVMNQPPPRHDSRHGRGAGAPATSAVPGAEAAAAAKGDGTTAMDEMRACDSAQAPCCATCNEEAPDRRSPRPHARRNNARERPPLGGVRTIRRHGKHAIPTKCEIALASGWTWHAEVVADPAGGVRVDLGVAWHARPSTVRSDPDVVLGAVTMQARAVTSQPTLQLAALHRFVRVAVGCAQCAGQQARGAPARRRAPG